nr:unnamed protein product [Callosobruchus chinensis]
MLDGDVTDAVEARSLSLNPHHIDIYSASWGPDDDGKTGRKGKGSIFIWASGNGGRDHDNCNCDGYTNSIYSLSISSATEHGHVPWYSEACSSTLASTYSSGAVGERQVVTTDLRHSCTSSHTGTSASAPLAAGICALALEANPNLTWRDMQHIVVRTARPQNLIAPDWQTNGVGRNVSHSFGYGLMDAYAMVQLARNWITVPEQHKPIPAKSVVVLQLQVKECEGVEVLEHVQAKLTIFSQRRGDLNIQLTSPMGTRVTLLAHRAHDNSRSGFNVWPFMSVHSWGESPFGTWQLEIHNDGRLLAQVKTWQLTLYGTTTPPAYDLHQKVGGFPSSYSDDIFHNSIDDSSSNWRMAENRKDIQEVEGKKNNVSSCVKAEGNLCLECDPNEMLYKNTCIQRCREKFYNSLLDFPGEIADLEKNQTCLACHYTCRNCMGSLDSQCIECYGDAKLFNVSKTESFCYPISLVSEVLAEKWYHSLFTFSCILVIILAVLAVTYCVIKRRKNRNDAEYHKLNITDEIRSMEKEIKSAVYSDSE